MKQILLTAVILAMGIAPAFGQKHVQNEKKHSVTHNERRFTVENRRNRPTRVHLYAGLGSSNVNLLTKGLKVESERALLSPTVGVDVRIPIGRLLDLTPGFSYNQRGIRIVSQNPIVGVTTVRTPIHTLSGSLLLGTSLGDNDFRLRFNYGLYAGYAIGGSAIKKVSKGGGNVEVYEVSLPKGSTMARYSPLLSVSTLGHAFLGALSLAVTTTSPSTSTIAFSTRATTKQSSSTTEVPSPLSAIHSKRKTNREVSTL